MKMNPTLLHHQLDSCKTVKGIDFNMKKKKNTKKSLQSFEHADDPSHVPRQERLPVIPNYMKSTTSSEARKEERKQAVAHITRVERIISSKLNSETGHKLARISRLGMVRSLTKAPSFKQATATQAGKCSTKSVSVSETKKIDVHKPTCSSTLKDSKFAPYLLLNPGGTESKGASAIKVCPYTYCSLNGHYLNILTPLKRFLCERRRVLKTQRIMNLEIVPPCKIVPKEGDQVQEVDPGLMIVHDSSITKAGSDDWTGFFIEIHLQKRDLSVENEGDGEVSGDMMGSLAGESEADRQTTAGEQAAKVQDNGEESLEPNSTPRNNHEQEKDVAVLDMNSLNSLEVDLYEADSSTVAEEQAQNGVDPEMENSAGGSFDELFLQNLHTEWEKVQPYASEPENGDFSSKSEHECEILYLQDELGFTANENTGKILEEIHDQVPQASSDEITDSHDCVGDLYSSIDGEWLNITHDQSTRSGDWSSSAFSGSSRQQLEEAKTLEEEELSFNSEIEHEDSMFRDDTTIYTEDDTMFEDEEAELKGETEVNPLTLINISEHKHDFAETYFEESNEGNKRCETVEANYVDRVMQAKDWEATETRNGNFQDSEMYANTNFESMTENEVQVQVDEMEWQHEVVVKQNDHAIADASKRHEIEVADQVNDEEKHCESSVGANNEYSTNHPLEALEHLVSGSAEREAHHYDSEMNMLCSVEKCTGWKSTEKEDMDAPNETETLGLTRREATMKNSTSLQEESHLDEELPQTSDPSKRATRSAKLMEGSEEQRYFNPREPNFQPLERDPDAEKVGLRHQEIDERKNAEEWMLDYALQRTVSKLAPARKKKVALLVAAFETVIPVPKWEPHHLGQSRPGFVPHTRLMEACS